MKKLVLLVAALSFFVPLGATAQEEETPIVFVLTTKTLSSYLGVNGLVFYDGPVNQTDLFVAFPNGLYLDVWGSVGLDNIGIWQDFDEEVDFTVGWSGEVLGFSVNTGVSYFAIVNGGIGLKDVLNPYADLSRGFAIGSVSVSPYVRLEHYHPWSGDTPHQGWQSRVGGRFGIPISSSVALGGSSGLFYDTGSFGFDRGWLGEVSLSVDWQVNGSTTVSPVVNWISPLEEMAVRESSISYGVSLSKVWEF